MDNSNNKKKYNYVDRTRSKNAINGLRYRTRIRRRRNNIFLKVVIIILIMVALVFATFALIKSITSHMIENEVKNLDSSQMPNDIYIDFSLIGMKEPLKIKTLTKQEVYDKVLNFYTWDLNIKNSNPEIDIFEMPDYGQKEEKDLSEFLNADTTDIKGTSQVVDVENIYKDITITATKTTYKIPDILQNQLKEFIDMIYKDNLYNLNPKFNNKLDGEEVECDFKFVIKENDDSMDDALLQLAKLWNTKAVKGQIEGFDKNRNEFVFGDDHKGYEVDCEEVRKKIINKMKAGEFTGDIYTVLKVIDPVGNSVKALYKYISSFETITTNNEIRNKNIELACNALNGTIVKPGEEFSFNKRVGERTEQKGYGPAPAYNQGEVVEELGGGVCQVSTTLYNAVYQTGLTTTSRKSHTFIPTYVTPGLDATVSYYGPDYKFINDSDYAVGIRSNYKNNKVKVEIFSVPILEEGVEQFLVSKKIQDIDKPPISIIEEGVATRGTKGAEYEVFKVVRKGTTEISRMHDHYARYEGHTPTAYESNTYIDKNGELQTRSFKTGGYTKKKTESESNESAKKSENETGIPSPAFSQIAPYESSLTPQ